MHRNLACVIDKSSRGAKLERAFEELPSVKNLSCYKKNVSEEGFRIFNANPPSLIARAIQQHIDKFKLIEKITLVDAEITHKELESFLKKQCSMVVDEQRGYILNTSCFAISELYPKKLAEALKNK